MSDRPIHRLAATALALLLAAGPAAAAPVLLSEDFDAENGGATALNYTDFRRFDVARGSVDLVAHGDFGLSCAGGTGSCVDLDGSTEAAGTLGTTLFFLSGELYVLTFDVSGNQRGGAPDTLRYGVDQSASETVTLAADDPFRTVSLTFEGPGVLGTSVFFEAEGGDNLGPILDNVTVAFVPLPASAGLLLAGLAALWGARRRT